MRSLTFSAADLVWRAKQKFDDEKNRFCYHDYDAALDDALFDLKQELDGLRERVDEVQNTDPSVFTAPDYPDWDALAKRVSE
jgi:cytochrome c556